MSYHVHLCQLGPNGGTVGTAEIFETPTMDDAINLAHSQLRQAPRAANRSMFRIYNAAHQMMMSYVSSPETARR